jgi:hypothetical protein
MPTARSPLSLLIFLLSISAVYASGKIYYGSRVGMQVTVVSIEGLDTSHAVIKTQHTRDDAIEFCREYVGEDPVTEKCIKEELATRLNDAIHADCPQGIFTDFFGGKFQFRGKNPRPADFGPKYILMNLETREIADGSSASGYPTNMEIFQALCPRTAPVEH